MAEENRDARKTLELIRKRYAGPDVTLPPALVMQAHVNFLLEQLDKERISPADLLIHVEEHRAGFEKDLADALFRTVEALEFYAGGGNYEFQTPFMFPKILNDNGSRAGEALSGLGEAIGKAMLAKRG